MSITISTLTEIVAYNSTGNIFTIISTGTTVTNITVGVSSATLGTVTTSGLFILYNTPFGYEGLDSFTYCAYGTTGTGSLVSNTATVSITVNPPPPRVLATSATVFENSNSSTVALSVLYPYNTATVVSPPSHGFAVSYGLNIAYQPYPGYVGTDSFTYAAINVAGISNVSTVTITVNLVGQLLTNLYASVGNWTTNNQLPKINQILGVFTASGTYNWIATIGVSSVNVVAVGGGGSGGGPGYGSGGGGGLAWISNYPVTALNTYTVVVGYASSGTTSTGLAGGVTYFNSTTTIAAYGGHGATTSTGALGGSYYVTPAYIGGGGTGGTGGNSNYGMAGGGGGAGGYAGTGGTGGSGGNYGNSLPLGTNGAGGGGAGGAGSFLSAINPIYFGYGGGGGGTGIYGQGSSGLVGSDNLAGWGAPTSTGYGYLGAAGGGGSTDRVGGGTTGTAFLGGVFGGGGASGSFSNNPLSGGTKQGGAGGSGGLLISSTASYTQITIVTTASYGVVTTSNANLIYNPTPGYIGTDSFTYRIYSPVFGYSDVGIAFINVILSIPPAQTVYQTVTENTILNNINLGISTTSYTATSIVSTASHGTATASGTYIYYTPNTNYFGSDTFVFGLINGAGISTATAYITIVQALPIANDITVSVAENSTLTNISLNVTNQYTTATVVTPAAHGTAISSSTNIYYTPTVNFFGTDTFTYSVSNPIGTSNIATATIHVAQPFPIANTVTQTVAFNSTDNNIVLNINNQYSSVLIYSYPSNGTAIVTASTQILYTPNTNFNGSDAFSYYASNDSGSSNLAPIDITVLPPVPVAFSTSASVLENSNNNAIVLPYTGPLNYSTIVTTSTYGSLILSGSIAYYTPNFGYFGFDQFQYTITNAAATSTAATVTIDVLPIPPIAYDSIQYVEYNSKNNSITLNVVNYYTGITLVKNASNGTITQTGPTSLSYTSNTGQSGYDYFQYQAFNSTGASNTATVAVITYPPYPVAYNYSQSVYSGSNNNTVNLQIANTPRTINIVSPPLHGTVSITGTTITYTPNSGYVGFDEFTYNYTNVENITSNDAQIFISVDAYTNPPIAYNVSHVVVALYNTAPNTYNTNQNVLEESKNNIIPTLTANSATTIQIVKTPNYGAAYISDLNVVYTPTVNFFGIDTIYYLATNSYGISNTATIVIDVTRSIIPITESTNFTVNYNSVNNTVPLIIGNQYSSVQVVTSPNYGIAVATGAGIVYSPNTSYYGLDSFTYTASNSNGVSNVSTVTITVLTTILVPVPPAGELQTGDIGITFSPLTFSALTGTPPYTVAISDINQLPPGLHFYKGSISGIPTQIGIYNFSITVTDSSTPQQLTTTTNYTLNISPQAEEIIRASDYNYLQSLTSNLITNLYGSNNTTFSTQLITGNLIQSNPWDLLYNDLERCYIHQYGVQSVIPGPVTTGSIVYADTTAAIFTTVTNLISNVTDHQTNPISTRTLVDQSQLLTTSTLYTTATSTSTRYELLYTWPTSNLAQAFFNLGGFFDTSVNQSQQYNVYSYYNNNFVAYSGPTPDNLGQQIITIVGSENALAVAITVTPNTLGITCATSINIFYTYSTDATGGIAAVQPNTQLNSDIGALSAIPVLPVTIYGHHPASTQIILKNTTPFTVTVSSITFNSDAATDVLLNLQQAVTLTPGFFSSPTTASVAISYQNNSVVQGLLNNSITVNSDSVTNPALTIPTPVITTFGFVTNPYPMYQIFYSNGSTPFSTISYGGVLAKLTNITLSTPGFSASILPNAQTKGIISVDTEYMINGPNYTIATITAIDIKGNYATETLPVEFQISVQEKHLGSWVSPQNLWDGFIGLSYDIINGQRCLTFGFGTGGGGSQQVGVASSQHKDYAFYEGPAVNQLDRKFNNKGVALYYSGTQTNYSTLLRNYGVWYTDLSKTLNEYYTFLVRDPGQMNVAFDFDAATASLLIDGSIVRTTAGTSYPTLTAGLHTVTIVATSHNKGTASVAVRITNSNGYDVWNTLDPMVPTWAEVGRITLTGAAQTYQVPPNLYNGNVGYNQTFASYFSNGSIISVTDNGYGELTIKLNGVASTSKDAAVTNLTLNNVQYLFYYNSLRENSIIAGSRFNNLPGGDNNYTPYFTGFLANGTVTTIIVGTPQALTQGTGMSYLEQIAIATLLDVGSDVVAIEYFGLSGDELATFTIAGDTVLIYAVIAISIIDWIKNKQSVSSIINSAVSTINQEVNHIGQVAQNEINKLNNFVNDPIGSVGQGLKDLGKSISNYSCVVATALTQMGIWSPRRNKKLFIWSIRHLDKTWFGRVLHRGYRIVGPKVMIPMLRGNNKLISQYIIWTFNNLTDFMQGNNCSKWTIPNSLMWLASMAVIGLFISNETAEKSIRDLYKGKLDE